DEMRFDVKGNGDWERSAIKQVASGRFGVNINYLNNADELQIKIAQGAKPGEGGHLPGHKVDSNIARVRNATPGVGLISPPPHHDIYSIEDLAQLIFDLKNANEDAIISVKLVSKAGVGVIASGVTKAHAEHILISGFDGGTGASPLSSIRHAGLPWELGLAETHQTLIKNGLRDRVVVQADGQIRSGRDLAIATMLGAEEWGIATAGLVVEGCIMMRKCHLNTCPVGIATQDVDLRKKFNGKVENVVNYFKFLAKDLREIMANCAVRSVNELVGRTDLLRIEGLKEHWKTANVDLTPLLFQESSVYETKWYNATEQSHCMDNVLDREIISKVRNSLSHQSSFYGVFKIQNTDRAVGTLLSSQIAKKNGSNGLPDKTIQLRFQGSAGQSFAAFASKGVQMYLEGEANDYFGKGLSGAIISVTIPSKIKINASENIVCGNVALYGATSGEAYINGIAGGRFAVRNSGATAVVEGVGDNGCEYMTGGKVIILGNIGRNFAAGMSGGIVYILKSNFDSIRLNKEMVLIEKTDIDDMAFIHQFLTNHFTYTGSKQANQMLADWRNSTPDFIKIIPKEYKAVLLKIKEKELTNNMIE
ncbi:glutamate synthase-related protein, partial [Bacteroidia bacterium]|nr:glutamate synthase-related protein [Bacteroidia bacterium]